MDCVHVGAVMNKGVIIHAWVFCERKFSFLLCKRMESPAAGSRVVACAVL